MYNLGRLALHVYVRNEKIELQRVDEKTWDTLNRDFVGHPVLFYIAGDDVLVWPKPAHDHYFEVSVQDKPRHNIPEAEST